MPTVKLTEARIANLRRTTGRRAKYYDSEMPGFGVRLTDKGLASFFVECCVDGRSSYKTIGPHGAFSLEEARAVAKKELVQAYSASFKHTSAPKMAFECWVGEYLEGVALRKKRPDHDRQYLSRCVARWGDRNLDDISTLDIERAMRQEAGRGNATANRWLASLQIHKGQCFLRTERFRRGNL